LPAKSTGQYQNGQSVGKRKQNSKSTERSSESIIRGKGKEKTYIFKERIPHGNAEWN